MKREDTHSSFCKESTTLSMRKALERDRCPVCRPFDAGRKEAYEAGRDDAATAILEQCGCNDEPCSCAFSPAYLADIARGLNK
jgi:hypothetical protein